LKNPPSVWKITIIIIVVVVGGVETMENSKKAFQVKQAVKKRAFNNC